MNCEANIHIPKLKFTEIQLYTQVIFYVLFFWALRCTWFGYNLQAELHCTVCLYSLIKEAVVRVKLKVHNGQRHSFICSL